MWGVIFQCHIIKRFCLRGINVFAVPIDKSMLCKIHIMPSHNNYSSNGYKERKGQWDDCLSQLQKNSKEPPTVCVYIFLNYLFISIYIICLFLHYHTLKLNILQGLTLSSFSFFQFWNFNFIILTHLNGFLIHICENDFISSYRNNELF